ncbi:GNAT family N-acetyltransferase [uncultured Intestinimonas sp.]|uniref:GNAT family N-acetyltransferase n=1 Tax=uncultured Intestinimonas sp. TaxID=1689265 RepID=UPI0029420DA9|nr:GNAT family N-acetyltransferase [uncultured Intestinimonas sp.]
MISFREIDKSNYLECICLKVKDEQRGFVADNARSLVEARFEEGLYTRAVYSGDTMVGFVLFDYDPEIPGWCMSRFMIGAQYQGQGLGKEAVSRFLDDAKERMGLRELYIHVELENTAAYELYQKLGFRFVKQIQYEFDGVVYRERQMKIDL